MVSYTDIDLECASGQPSDLTQISSLSYLIDFESCELYDTPEPNLKWEEMYADRVHPDHDLLSWGFENEETRQIVREFRKSRQSP